MKLSLRETSCDPCPTLPAALEAFAVTTLVFFKGPHFSSGDLCGLILIAALQEARDQVEKRYWPDMNFTFILSFRSRD